VQACVRYKYVDSQCVRAIPFPRLILSNPLKYTYKYIYIYVRRLFCPQRPRKQCSREKTTHVTSALWGYWFTALTYSSIYTIHYTFLYKYIYTYTYIHICTQAYLYRYMYSSQTLLVCLTYIYSRSHQAQADTTFFLFCLQESNSSHTTPKIINTHTQHLQ